AGGAGKRFVVVCKNRTFALHFADSPSQSGRPSGFGLWGLGNGAVLQIVSDLGPVLGAYL
ncbi:hypothetical protein, partial [Corynebacterium sp.]|uniref:hypothetical protein n=1 Tax=Corynebacterium sp. TaxID=1720 RepID=UPI0027B8F617